MKDRFYMFKKMGSEEEIIREVTCPMCMEVFRSPRLLDCMHSFCETCIKPLIAYDTGEITCPVCRHITKTANGTDSLTMNLIVQNIIGAMEVISLRSEGGLTCNECDQDEAVNFCCDCYERLCDVCTGYHKRSLKFKSHVIQPLDEISRDDMSQGRIKQCPEHNEMVKFYCNSCSYTICHDCTVSKKHSGHNFELLEEITSGNKENLKLLLQSATKKKKAVNKSIKEAEGIMQNIKIAKETSIMLLEETFNKIHELLNTKKTLLIKAVTKKYDEGLKSIKKAQENSQMLDDWIAFTNAVMSNKCNAEIMDIFKNLRRQLEEITVMTFMKPKALLEAEKIQKKPVVCANPNAKGRRRLSAQPQVLGLETESKTEKQEPFSPHSSLKKHNMESTKSLSKQQQQEKVKVKTQENTVPISDVNNNKRSSESSHLNGVVNNGEQLTRKIIPVEMTPDIDTSKQIQTEIWDFHEQKYKKDVVELSQEERARNRPRHLKNVPPPRPPPARVNSSRPLHKRRQSIPNKPTSAPPQPPVTTLPPLIRSKSQPQIYVSPRKNNQSSKRLRQPPRVPPPPPTATTVRASTPPPIPTSPPVVTSEPISTPPLVTSPPPIKTLLNQSTSFDILEIKFPVPPSSPPSESGDDTSGYTSNSDVSILPDDGEEKGQQEEQHILEADNKLDPKKSPPPSVVPPSPAPRFFAGITMVKQDIMINEDVVNLIMETINDSCSMSSDQNSDIACSDAMFSTKEEIFQQ